MTRRKLNAATLAVVVTAVAAAFSAAFSTSSNHAQSPSDTIKIIVPFAAGGPADSIARVVATPLGVQLGKTVVVDNRGGAGGVIGVGIAAGAPMVHIPYRGAAPALVDLIAGVVDLVNADVPVLRPYVRDGRIKALAIYDTKRSPQLPDVPTAAEAGMPSLNMTNWYGVLVPSATPPEVRARLGVALAQVVRQPEIAARLAEAGFSNPRDHTGFKTRLDADFEH